MPRFPVDNTPKQQIPLERRVSSLTVGDVVPLDLFGKDHWTTLAYVETCLVDYQKFVIQSNPRMRCSRRNWRIQRRKTHTLAVFMHDTDHATRLRDGTIIPGHDDWDCLQDLILAGLLRTRGEPDIGKQVTLTKYGSQIVAALREFKANGGSYASFVPPAEVETTKTKAKKAA